MLQSIIAKCGHILPNILHHHICGWGREGCLKTMLKSCWFSKYFIILKYIIRSSNILSGKKGKRRRVRVETQVYFTWAFQLTYQSHLNTCKDKHDIIRIIYDNIVIDIIWIIFDLCRHHTNLPNVKFIMLGTAD